ncbi:MAG: hypothetical protein Q9P90_17975 [candidate division KSB1 bacterium]|nr:hypothetical protein [candidate division KSB1 bacterium]
MKYMQNGKFNSNPLMRLTLIFTLIFFVAFWLTTAVMYFSKMNLAPASVVDYYRGNEELFKLPRTFGSMLEVTHGHLPVMALVALLLTHLFIFTPFSKWVKTTLIVSFFGAALVGEAASWLVRYVHPAFAYLKIASFLVLELSMALVIVALWRLMASGAKRNGRPRQLDSLEGRDSAHMQAVLQGESRVTMD